MASAATSTSTRCEHPRSDALSDREADAARERRWSPVTGLADALRGARVYDLEQPRYAGAPVFPAHEPGVLLHLHRRHEPGPARRARAPPRCWSWPSTRARTSTRSATRPRTAALHGGIAVDARVQTPYGFTALGVETIPPLLARGVLLDVAARGAAPRRASRRGARARGRRRAASSCAPATSCWCGSAPAPGGGPAGLPGGGRAGRRASAWLAERKPLAVGADNIAWDVAGEAPGIGTLPGHVLLLVRAGIYILEYVFLEELAADGVREFAFVCLPLKLRGGTGSPVRPIALVEVEDEPLL